MAEPPPPSFIETTLDIDNWDRHAAFQAQSSVLGVQRSISEREDVIVVLSSKSRDSPGSPKTTSLPHEACLICGQAANGNHYGARSCVRCKTFFRRAVLQKQRPKCALSAGKENEECSDGKLCRGCRFVRCLKFGMSVAALKPKRDIIGARRARNVGSKVVVNDDRKRIDCRPIATSKDNGSDAARLLRIIVDLTKYDQFVTRRKFVCLRHRQEAKRLAGSMNLSDSAHHHPDSPPPLSITQRDDMSLSIQSDLAAMLEWVKSIGQFVALPMEDQLVLLKRFAIYYLILEHGSFTVQSGVANVWMVSNGTCMPRDCDMLPEESKRNITEARKWRQKKLWREMTNRCIDEVALPLGHLQLAPEELLALKVILLFNCGHHSHAEDATLRISDESRKILIESKDQMMSALFEFYKANEVNNCEERFGNVLLMLSGVYSAGACLKESYQLMNLFSLMAFDRISEQLLFGV